MRRVTPLVVAAAVAVLLSGCAAPKVMVFFPAGRAILKGEEARPPVPPDSLRAELELIGYQGRRKTSVSAVLSAKPYRAYKLDLFGLPGMLAGSFLWKPAGWTLALYEQESYRNGQGSQVELEPLGMGPVPVHDLFAFIWGDFFPGPWTASPDAGGGDSDSLPETARLPSGLVPGPDGTLRYGEGENGWILKIDPRSGLVAEAVLADSSYRITFADYRDHAGRPLPGRVCLASFYRPLLEIRVKDLVDNPRWRKNPFQIKIPEGFREITSDR